MPLGQFLGNVTRLLFPPRCRICGAFCPDPLCADCHEALPRIEPPMCCRCGRPFDTPMPAEALCGKCRTARSYLAAARAWGRHGDKLQTAVNRLKFNGTVALSGPLGELLAELVTGSSARLPSAHRITDVIPVPLHDIRLRERGFNQAELIAQALGAAASLPVRTGVLLRTRNTPPQVNLSAKQREGNVRGAFAVRHRLPVDGVYALLVDDVYTTGATLEECARTLLDAGAEAAYAVTVSRRLLD